MHVANCKVAHDVENLQLLLNHYFHQETKQMLEIVEILRPAEQGRNKAFICRGEDDQLKKSMGSDSIDFGVCFNQII